MDIISKQEHMIFKNEDGKYCIGLLKKTKDGKYENGYIPVYFKKDVILANKTKIKIKSAWLDFFKKDKKTYIYAFINDFEIVKQEEKQEQKQEEKSIDKWESAKDIDEDSMELPFY